MMEVVAANCGFRQQRQKPLNELQRRPKSNRRPTLLVPRSRIGGKGRGSINPLKDALETVGLPRRLVELIAAGTLLQELEKAYALLDELNELMDALEARNPEGAKALPWYEAREAWKVAGRPRPPWYQALTVYDGYRTYQRFLRNLKP